MSITKEYISILIPLILTVFASFMYSIIDSYFISLLGEEQLAGIGLVSPMNFLMISLAYSVASGVGIILSQAHGGNNLSRIKLYIFVGTLITMVLSLVLIVLFTFFETTIFNSYAASENIINYAKEYYSIWIYLILIEGIVALYTQSLNSIGKVKIATQIQISFLFLNIFLNYVLMFGVEGYIEAMGISGVALATLISKILMFIVLIIILKSQIKIVKSKKLLKIAYLKIMHLVPSVAMQGSMMPISMYIISILISKYGSSVIAAYVLTIRLEYIYLIISMATGSVVTILASKYEGQKQFSKVIDVFKLTNRINIVWGLVIILFTTFYIDIIGDLFLTEPETKKIFNFIWGIAVYGYIAWGLQITIQKMMLVLGFPKYSFYIALIRALVFFLGITMIMEYFFGLEGYVYSNMLQNYVAVGISTYIFFRIINHEKYKNVNII